MYLNAVSRSLLLLLGLICDGVTGKVTDVDNGTSFSVDTLLLNEAILDTPRTNERRECGKLEEMEVKEGSSKILLVCSQGAAVQMRGKSMCGDVDASHGLEDAD